MIIWNYIQTDEEWAFIIDGELLYVDLCDWGWKVNLGGSEVHFEDVYALLDWYDEFRNASTSMAVSEA